jgi:uncharacterized membrane protein
VRINTKNVRGAKIINAPKGRNIDYLTILIIASFVLLLLSQAAVILSVIIPYQKEFGYLFKYFVFAFIVFHAIKTIGVKNGLFFIGLCVVAALIGEYGATSRGWFYGHYVFADVPYTVLGLPSYKIAGVPLEGLFSWAISIYLAYCITNLIFRGYKSDVRRTLTYSLIPFLAVIDGILVTNVNMLTDPIAVQAKAFYYVNGVVGEYFGIPVFTSVSWFLTIFLIMALFRSYEFRGIKRRQYDPSFPSQLLRGRTVNVVDIMPLFVFLVWALIRYGALALVYKHVELVLIGIAGMVPSAIIFLLAYFVLKYEKATDNVTNR